MSNLPDDERARLTALGDHVRSRPEYPTAAGRTLADHLRRMLPDLDDATIGRVAFQIGRVIGVQVGVCAGTATAANTIMCAALDLTALELHADGPHE